MLSLFSFKFNLLFNIIKVSMGRFFVNLNISCAILFLMYPVISSAITMLTIHFNKLSNFIYSSKLFYFVYFIVFSVLIIYCYKKRNIPDYWRVDRYRSHVWGHALLIIANLFASLSIIFPISLAWLTGNSNWMFLLWLVPMILLYAPFVWILGLVLIWRSRKIQ